MPSTSTMILPYPSGSDPVAIVADLQALAVAADSALKALETNQALAREEYGKIRWTAAGFPSMHLFAGF